MFSMIIMNEFKKGQPVGIALLYIKSVTEMDLLNLNSLEYINHCIQK